MKNILQLKKCLKELAKCGSKALWMVAVLAVLEAVIPLGKAVITYLLIEGMELEVPFLKLLLTALGGFLIMFMLQALRGKMSRCHGPYTEDGDVLLRFRTQEKTMEMDYEQLDDPETATLRAKIENDYNWGCGGYAMVLQFQGVISGIAGILAAFVVLLPVLLEGGIWKHWSSLVFFVFVILVITISVRSEIHARVAEEVLRNRFDKASRRRNWLMKGGLTYREGKDIRIYKAQPLIKKALVEETQDQMVNGESRIEQRAGALDGAASGLLLGFSYLFIVLRALSGVLSVGTVVLFA